MKQEYWTSRTKTITAFLGSTIGLSNIWDLPSQILQNGGIIYLLFYILTSAFITFSFFIGLLGLGRMSRGSVVTMFRKGFYGWRILGYIIVVMSVFIASNYLVAVGSVLKYVFWNLTGLYNVQGAEHLQSTTTFYDYWNNYNTLNGKHLQGVYSIWDKIDSFLPFHAVAKIFSYAVISIRDLYSSNYHMTLNDFHTHYNNYIATKIHGVFSVPVTYSIFVVLICFILLYQHIHVFLEKFFWYSVLLCLFYLLILVIHSSTSSNYYKGISEFLIPKHYSLAIFFQMIKNAIMKSFFSLSLGFGVTLTYGSYTRKASNLLKLTIWIISIDVIVSIAVLFLILPIIHNLHLTTYNNEDILFVIMPMFFSSISHGVIWGEIFYIIVFMVAIATAVSFLEVIVSVLKDKTGMDRHFVAFLACGVVIFLTIHIDLSHGPLALLRLYGIPIYQLVDIIFKQIGIPFVSLMLSLYIGWVVKKDVLDKITTIEKVRIHMSFTNLWSVIIKYITPIFCLYSLIENLYIIFK